MEKVELILEAATRLLESGDIRSLTTNTLAEKAGVSIGTLYQYFKNKEAVLEALTEREMAGLSKRVLASFQGSAPVTPGERIGAIVRAVLATYGGRRRAHRTLMAHAMSSGGAGRLAPLYRKLIELFRAQGPAGSGPRAIPLSPAEAFVLTHAVAGVVRTLVTDGEHPPREEIEKALTRLVLGFFRTSDASQP
ncbi:TetR/AcrR family transcriptional regulator [Nibricoccus aquaticus]|uniref:TetR/AcrR family transcriptional regulator n=1 Tax=Nibricoccus aquaticus TaxID=2576891 RepID=UPI001586D6D7|nr:TetR/AcrR family transcriptional regulator [Nibricoccus aquaticus]